MHGLARTCGLLSLAALAEGFVPGVPSVMRRTFTGSAIATKPVLALRMQTGGKGLKGLESSEEPDEAEYLKNVAARKKAWVNGESKVSPTSDAFKLVYEDEGEMFDGERQFSDRDAYKLRVSGSQGFSMSMDYDEEDEDDELEKALLAMFVQQGDAPVEALKMKEAENFEGVEVTVDTAGDGKTFPQKGDILTVEYEGRLVDGTVFDSSKAAGTPFKFPIGRGQVIAGWEEALVGMSLGETAVVKIGANKAYGDKGFGSIIPPRSCLTFTITLLGINQTMAKSAGASSSGRTVLELPEPLSVEASKDLLDAVGRFQKMEEKVWEEVRGEQGQ